MRRQLLLPATLLATGAIVALVFYIARKNPPVYSVGVSEYLRRGMWDQTVRVRGTLVHGTLCKLPGDCGYALTMQNPFGWRAEGSPQSTLPDRLSVIYDGCVIPDTLRDVPGWDIEVLAEGERCQGCHDFKASQLMAKCPSKYEMRFSGSPPLTPIPPCQARAPGT